jgi:preprotein translocase subunit SecG
LGSAFIPRQQAGVNESMVRDQIENTVDPTQVPSFPTTPPATTNQQNTENPVGGDDNGQQ